MALVISLVGILPVELMAWTRTLPTKYGLQAEGYLCVKTCAECVVVSERYRSLRS